MDRAVPLPIVRIVYQHDGNVVLDLVDVAALLAGERVELRLVVQITFALRAAQDFEQFRLQHRNSPVCS